MKTRQQRAHRRGYNFENELVNNFRDYKWNAKRLGGSSIHIPDIVATWRHTVTVQDSPLNFDYQVTVEAKSTGRDRVEIPGDEVWRCIDWFKMYPLYNVFPLRHKYAIFAYKFLSTKAGDIKKEGVKRRPVKEYYHILKLSDNPNTVMPRSFISGIKEAYCNYSTGPGLVFKDSEREQYTQAMVKSKILKTVNSFKDVIDTILFEC